MPVVRESAIVELSPVAALALWTDTSRWPTFVDGFARVAERSDTWPEAGSKVVWESGPAGRGRVTERVVLNTYEMFETQIFEERMTGTQTVFFEPDEAGALVTAQLEYELVKGGPLRALTDLLFIRRALTDALARTLRRFGTEAAEQATL
jgi:hypothetical protein